MSWVPLGARLKQGALQAKQGWVGQPQGYWRFNFFNYEGEGLVVVAKVGRYCLLLLLLWRWLPQAKLKQGGLQA